MSESAEARLERELRELLRDRDPGAAPIRLRDRVERIPEGALRPQGPRVARAALRLLGLAAVIAIAVLGVQLLRYGGPLPQTGASPVPTPAPSFDPNLVGPGVGADGTEAALWVMTATVAAILGLLAWGLRGRWRLVPGGLAIVLLGYALVGSFAPVEISQDWEGPGLHIVAAAMPPGATEDMYYETAPARQPFSVGIGIVGSGPLPIRVEGIDDPTAAEDYFGGMRWRAVWLDNAPNGGSIGPARPFTPFDLPHPGQTLWLVGQAGACAVGPSFLTVPSEGIGFASLDSIRLRVSVLGWPRVIQMPLNIRLVEPDTMCAGEPASPAPSPSPSVSPSAAS